jgi:hypothetical protein
MATATATATTIATAAATPTTACPVTYVGGWNLVGGPSGTVMNGSVELFSLPAGATSYTQLPTNTPLTAPNGYWAFFSTSTTDDQPCVTAGSTIATLSANTVEMEGNPFNQAAYLSASGATTYAITFNTASNSFGSWTRIDSGGSLSLPQGSGAFVVALSDSATLTISTAPLPTS